MSTKKFQESITLQTKNENKEKKEAPLWCLYISNSSPDNLEEKREANALFDTAKTISFLSEDAAEPRRQIDSRGEYWFIRIYRSQEIEDNDEMFQRLPS